MESILPASRTPLFEKLSARTFTWWPERHLGFYPVEVGAKPYDSTYFARYAAMAETELGRALTKARLDFVGRHTSGPVVDVGIGSGAFVHARNKAGQRTTGYDVNPAGLDWLHSRYLFADPYRHPVNAMTLWDVLEHIPDFRPLINNALRYVFVSVPIFSGPLDVMRSKHFRRDEHVWYFTTVGIRQTFAELGFECVEVNQTETDLGRDSIGSFAFRRVS